MDQINEFIAFYESIPDEKWCVNKFVDGEKKCALGHLGERLGKEPPMDSDSFRLQRIFRIVNYPQIEGDSLKFSGRGVRDVNDGRLCEELGKTPKERILAILAMAKESNDVIR